ncbi:MAG: AI-2E family transporter [Micrococcales bacterium]|nr:AI-2E family transporter [Micrococcales bacterium]
MKIQNAFRLGLIGGLGVLLALAIGGAVQSLAPILTYVGAALFLALGIDPAVSFLQRRALPRWLSIVIVLLVIVGVFVGLIFAVVPVISDQVSTLIAQAPDIGASFQKNGAVREWFAENVPWLDLDQVYGQAQDWIRKNTDSITNGVIGTATSIATGAFGVLIVLILTLYFVSSLSSIKRGLYQLVPASKRERFTDIAEQISAAVGRYVVGQVALGLCNGILTFLFLNILGIPLGQIQYSALLAFIAFLFSLLPLVGTVTGSVVITLLVWLFNGWPAVLVVAIYYLIYMQVEAYFLSPNIMNRAVKIPGVLVVIAALAGGTLLGILGALVAIPTAAAILLIVREVVVPRQNAL